MTLIGKIFTVMILIMSIVFMTCAMMVYATHKNWREVVKGGGSTKGLETTLNELRTTEKDLNTQIELLKREIEVERAARRYALAALSARAKTQEVQLAQLNRDNEQLTKSESDMKVLLKLAETNSKNFKQEVDVLRVDIKKAEDDRDSQFDQVVTLTDQLQQYKVEQDRLKERETQLVDRTARMKRVLTALGKTEFMPVDNIPPPLDGRITAVNAENMVEISLGSDDGLNVGNTLDVFRGNTYLGRIIIRETDPDRAVGEIIRDSRRGLIKKGDYVSTKLG